MDIDTNMLKVIKFGKETGYKKQQMLSLIRGQILMGTNILQKKTRAKNPSTETR